MRKICFDTSFYRGEQFCSRVMSEVETCKKLWLSALDVIVDVVSSVI
ncbi:hypothetical protein [Candidatus Enterovibrio escicola]|uniref:Uncharacterized protein n=1 Tax=Candidatus Enterovibrio escicola TaxID=1927127 RepID=A0A2A5T4I3_9GAMM|nr:hypothetical protein BTN49_1068 [Candidatus Enterovibrio escacola]